MSLTTDEIAAVVAELASLAGGAIQRAWAPEPRTAVLRVRGAGATHLLLVSAEADVTRIHRAQERPRPQAGPAPFQEALRAWVEGRRLARVVQVGGDRVVALELDGERPARLVAELTGRHGNLLLLDADDVVRHTAVPDPSRKRDNRPGRPYTPPEPGGAPPRATPSRVLETGSGGEAPFPVSRAIEAAYGEKAARRVLEGRRKAVARPVRAALKRLDRALERLDAEAARAEEAETVRHRGELLKTVLHQVPRGATSVRAVDYAAEGMPEVEIPLDPKRSPKENLEHLFARHRKLAATPERVAARREALAARRPEVERLLGRIEAAEDGDALEAAAEAARAAGYPAESSAPDGARSRKPRAQAPRRPYRRFTSATGHEIRVGRGAEDNHALTFQAARGNDVWMHVRGTSGSHVVVPTGGHGRADEPTLLDAATLAAHFSRARGEPRVEIGWTLRKHLGRPKGAPKGTVTVAGERVIPLRMEEDRLQRLLASEVPGD